MGFTAEARRAGMRAAPRVATHRIDVAAAMEQTGWIVFFSHDVDDHPSPYGATPQMLEHALETVSRAGIDILPVKHALARAAFG